MEQKKFVLFIGGIETQEYFSIQMGNRFRQLGYPVFYYDISKKGRDAKGLREFLATGNPVAITFNFHGLNGEEGLYDSWDVERPELTHSLWDETETPCHNILLDHPLYYYQFYDRLPKHYRQWSVDRKHQEYMKNYYPEVSLAGFLPLAGTLLSETPLSGVPVSGTAFSEASVSEAAFSGGDAVQKLGILSKTAADTGLLSMEKRKQGVVFTGNYTPPSVFEPYILRNGKEYADFYYGIIEELLRHPERTLEEVGEERLREEMGAVGKEELRQCFAYMNFIDLYVRNELRGRVIASLAEAGITVSVYGKGWDKLWAEKGKVFRKHCRVEGALDSLGCLRVMTQAKISMDVMPWFRDGAHDRIFNSMLNGAVCCTDGSRYLSEQLIDGQEVVFYDRSHLEQLPGQVQDLLDHPERLALIQEMGFWKAAAGHTWALRAEILANHPLFD